MILQIDYKLSWPWEIPIQLATNDHHLAGRFKPRVQRVVLVAYARLQLIFVVNSCWTPFWNQCVTAKAPCKRTQHVGTTSPNIVGIVLADVGFRVFKRSQHVGQCCFYGNTLGSLAGFDIYPKLFAKLQCCHVRPPIMALAECRRWKTRKCIAFAFVLCYLENTPSHINKDRELKQRGMSMRTLQNNRLNYRIQSLHVGM